MTNQTLLIDDNAFLHMVYYLLETGNVILHQKMLDVTEGESQQVVDYLQEFYEREAQDYPHSSPKFDGKAALWAATMVYRTSQLYLFRDQKHEDIPTVLPEYEGELTPGAVLSADLCLRFVPSMMMHLKAMNSEDPILGVLENHMKSWHYSNIPRLNDIDGLEMKTWFLSDCLKQLYIDRIIEHKNERLANHSACKALVLSSLGIHQKSYWPTLMIN